MAEANSEIVAGMEDLSVTAAGTLATHPQAQPPAVINFPLPRELRDQIYGYLLSHEHVHDKPWHTRPDELRGKSSKDQGRDKSTARTYRFHPNILAINKTIRQEALETVVRSIVFSWDWKLISEIFHDLDVPIVTDNEDHIEEVQKSGRWALCVHVGGPASMKGGRRCVLMLHSDLPALLEMLQYAYYYIHSPAQLVVDPGTHGGVFMESGTTADGLPSLRCLFQVSGPTMLTINQSKSTLAQFQDVVLGKQDVKFQQVPASLRTYASAVTHAMSPRSVWLDALAWRMYESLQRIKSTADELTKSGNYAQASVKYCKIWKLAHASQIFGAPGWSFNTPFGCGVTAILAVLFGAVVTDGFLRLRNFPEEQKRIELQAEVALNIAATLQNRMPDPMRSRVKSMLSACQAEEKLRWFRTMSKFSSRKNLTILMDCNAEMMGHHASLSASPYFKRDFDVVIGTYSNGQARDAWCDGDPAYVANLQEQLSLKDLPPMILDVPLPAGLFKPAGLVGLTNTTRMQQLRATIPAWYAMLL